ncbi:SMC family ATPase [Candidatus Babeliales bacterium]|nr:SMC family ATPase [Candidatus Babeliales bacterium]MBP9843566.1 SMC family ATPase [Candidatus Babeliales bacterium]
MIPKKLQIKNFLSYGPEPQIIDFLSYNLICLSGKNGHGKSALLDAMTWALWGQARKTTGTSKADEGLVHLGQKHMLVTLDFEINNTAYRVRREFVKTQSTPFSALDFGIVKADGTFTTLTDKTIKLTQTKLEKTIGITFESFINSAFLRQGQANEFSKKSPKERKEILATILQLERFEDLKKVAIEKTKTLQQDFLQKQGIYNRVGQEITDLQTALLEKESHAQQLELIEVQEQLLGKILIEDEEKKAALLELHKKYEIVQVQKKQHEQQLTEIEQQIIMLEKTFQHIASQQSAAGNIAQLEEEQKRLRAIVSLHQEKLNKRLELKDQYLTLQEKKQVLEKELAQQTAQLAQKYEITSKIVLEQIEQHKQLLAVQEKKAAQTLQEIIQHQAIIIAHEKIIEEKTTALSFFPAHEKQFEDHKNQYQAYKTQTLLLEQQLVDLVQKHTLSLNNQDPSCPLCEQNLSASRKKFLEQKFNESSNTTQLELEKIKVDTAQLHKTLIDEHAILQQYKKENDELTKTVSQTDAIKQQLEKLQAQAEQDHQQIVIITAKIDTLHQDFAHNEADQKKSQNTPFDQEKEQAYQTFIKKIDVLKQTAQTLAYDKLAHDKDFKELQDIDAVLTSHQELQKEIAQQEQRRKQIIDLQQHSSKINESCKIFDEQLLLMKDCPVQLTEHLKIELSHKQQAQAITAEKSNLLNKKAIFDLQHKKMVSLQNEQNSIEKELKIINLEIIDFTEIGKALGKDGLQALLIEQALPEIEQQANILLAQLTDNQTQIFIESLRDLKKGGSKETLDIKISDAVGLRPYEMFSGGEAFRIDFALRIAISKLLARRAGTALQTLIIDEGFGSQDDDGLQMIMDSILKIQDNFAKVIIVSHLPSMKEQFPVQFLIQKKASGSTVTVIEQG